MKQIGPGATISDELNAARDRLGSYDEVAEAIGTSGTNVLRWRDGTVPGPEFYDRLMAFLGVDLDALGALIIIEQLRRFRPR